LQKQVENLISDVENVPDDAHLSVYLPHDGVEADESGQIIQLSPLPQPLSAKAAEMLSLLDDLGCPRYCDTELIPIAMLRGPNIFATYLRGRLLYEVKFTSFLPTDRSLYTVQLLHCMNGTPGIPKFAGVVVDSSGQQLRSYLKEIPGKGWMFDLITKGLEEGRPVSWCRREHWARQIVEAIRQVHSKGFVVGSMNSLGNINDLPVVIDNMDQAMLWNFNNKLWIRESRDGYLPPEYRQNVGMFRNPSTVPPAGETAPVTPRADIFHLGMVLWLLAQESTLSSSRYFCEKVGCLVPAGAPCYDQHADPVTLPPLSNGIPQYYQDAIAACRSYDPNQRPPAWKLLQMFPHSSIVAQERQAESLKNDVVSLEVITKNFRDIIYCDVCVFGGQGQFFHCNTCLAGDFDLCQGCFDKGTHCHDESHFLVEMISVGGWVVVGETYYSNLKSNGLRETMRL